MKTLIQFFIKNGKLTFVLTVFVAIFGLLGFSQLRNESMPSVNFAIATVVTQYPGASPEEVETRVTKPLEDEIKTVTGLKDVTSTSQSGRSVIVIRVDIDREGIDSDEVINDLQKAIDRVTDLPPELPEAPKFTELNSEEFPAIQFAVTGSNVNRKRDIIVDQITDELEDFKDISKIEKLGYREREFSVKLDTKKMDQDYISISEIFKAIKDRNINTPAGDLTSFEKQKLIRLDGKVKNEEDLKNLYIRANFTGQSIMLRDIANVKDGYEENHTQARINGEEATILIVNKKGGFDTIELVAKIDKTLNLIKKKLPEGYKIITFMNESKKVKNRFEVLESNAFSGLMLVIFFLLLFLPGKIGIMSSFSLPLAIMGSIGFMAKMGINFHAVSILALVIALGMLVDNSVVISENFARLKDEGLSNFDAALKAAHQFWLPITATALTTIAAFLPMLVTKGIMGLFIRSIPILVTCSLLISLAESFFLLPMRLNFIGGYRFRILRFLNHKKNKTKSHDNNWFKPLALKFERFMRVCIKHRYLVLLGFLSIVSSSFILIFKANQFILFPPEQNEVYIARFENEIGDSYQKTHEVTRRLSLDIKEALGDDVEFIKATSGDTTTTNDHEGEKGDHKGVLTIYMTKEASLKLHYMTVLGKLREIPTPYLKSVRYKEVTNGPPVGEDINVTFRSYKVDSLNTVTGFMEEELNKIDGIKNLKVEETLGKDELHVVLDHYKTARLGLDVATIGQTVKMALEGIDVTKLNINDKKFNLKVQLAESDKRDIEDLKKIKVSDKKGNLIPLSQVATFKKEKGSAVIKRFDYQRSKRITGTVDKNKISPMKANADLREIFSKINGKYPEVSYVFGGQEESTKESMESLFHAEVLALIAIFAILVFVFNSFLRPGIIMSTIPLGLVGFSIAFYFHNRPISFLAMIGIVGLTGIIVNSGIVLISFIDDMRKESRMDLHSILAKASSLRLRAVLVTSLTTISGLFPTAYGIGGHDIILVPMTLSMAWGLTSGTILTLVWIPCAYAILEDFLNIFRKLFSEDDNTQVKYSDQEYANERELSYD